MTNEINILEEYGLGFQRSNVSRSHIFVLESNGVSLSIEIPTFKKHLQIISKPSLFKTSIHAYNRHNLVLLYYNVDKCIVQNNIDLPSDAIWLVVSNFSDSHAMYKLIFS